jgi:ankyrin repeat protein
MNSIAQWLGTGLHRASKFGFLNIVKLLLQHGADPNFLDKVCCFVCVLYVLTWFRNFVWKHHSVLFYMPYHFPVCSCVITVYVHVGWQESN